MTSSLTNRLPVWLLLLLVWGGTGGLLGWLGQRYPTISDSVGYLYAGIQLANGEGLAYQDPLNETVAPYFLLHAYRIHPEKSPQTVYGYPPGLPFLLGVSLWLTGGWQGAVFWVVPALAVLGLIGIYFLAYHLSQNQWLGLWATLLVAFAPTFWDFGSSIWSDLPSMSFGVGVYLFYLWAKEKSGKGWWWQMSAGICLFFCLFLRYTNAVLLFPLFVYELIAPNRRFFQNSQLFWTIAGLAIVSVLLFNQWYYGGALRTIYSSPELGAYPWPIFSTNYAFAKAPAGGGRSVPATAQLFWRNFSFLLLLAPLGWLQLRRFQPSKAWLVVLGGLVTIGLYATYAFAPIQINGRFMLPAFPFVAIAIAAGFSWLADRLPHRSWRWLLGSLLALWLFSTVPNHWNRLLSRNEEDQNSVAYAQQLVAATPDNAVFLSYLYNDLIRFYGHRSVLNYRRIPPPDPTRGNFRVEVLTPCLVIAIDRLLNAGIPVYYVADQNPSFWRSQERLAVNYTMTLIQADLPVWQLAMPASLTSRSPEGKCP